MHSPIDPTEAIRCLQQLSVAGELARVDISEVARAEGLATDRVQTILDSMVRAGFVECSHDRYRLVRTPASILVADVWAALNETAAAPRPRGVPGSPGATTIADLLDWESRIFEHGPIAHAA